MVKKKLLAILLGLVLLLSGCLPKKALYIKDFDEKMIENDYVISDIMSQFEPVAKEKIKSVHLAVSKDKSHQLEFYTLASEDVAKHMFESNKVLFEKDKTDDMEAIIEERDNYDFYKLVVNNRVFLISRIDSTLLYANVDSKLENTLDETVKKLGY